MLAIRDSLPEGFLDCAATDLHRLFGGPTLIRLPGRREAPLFVSVLLHGNENSGLDAVQQVLRARALHGLPRAMMLMIGNVEAARHGVRRLPGQPDYNRVWPGTVEHRDTPEAAIMAQAAHMVTAAGAFAAIDLHNNSGLNPHYGVVCSLDPRSLHLAALFSRQMVWFGGLAGTQTLALAGKVPAMAAECGKPGVPRNAEAAARFVDAVLELSAFPDHAVRRQDIDLHHSLAVVRANPDVSISFGGEPAQLRFRADLDHLNFRMLEPGTALGQTDHPRPLVAVGEDGEDVTDQFLSVRDGRLELARGVMPAMLSLDETIVRQDCLCYLMDEVPRHLLPAGSIA